MNCYNVYCVQSLIKHASCFPGKVRLIFIDVNLKLHCINVCYGNKQLTGST